MNEQDLNRVLKSAFDYFNDNLFEDCLPDCVIVLQRKRGANGYFWAEQWINTDTQEAHHEIALNPDTFAHRSTEDILSTLVHEMVHMQQHCHGKPGANGYHNLEWVRMMEDIGLEPYSIDDETKQTGTRVTHRISEHGLFKRYCDRFIATGVEIVWHTKTIDPDSAEGRKAKTKRASKTKFTCPSCGLNAWAKPDASIGCWTCGIEMEDNDD